MSRARRLAFGALLALVALTASGCDEGGIGMGVPSPTGTGARWGTGGSGPGVIVGGGPVYR